MIFLTFHMNSSFLLNIIQKMLLGTNFALHFNLTTLRADSAGDELVIYFLILPRKQDPTLMQIVSQGENLHEVSHSIFQEKHGRIFQNVVF